MSGAKTLRCHYAVTGNLGKFLWIRPKRLTVPQPQRAQRSALESQIHIPEEWQVLVDCLRCAIHNMPAPDSLQNTDWATLLRKARQHRVEHFLFPWLAQN